MSSTGAYAADRASALSGVPKSTIHYWAREGILVPSVSDEKVKLWSYSDLVGLRTIYWLRQRKTSVAGAEIPRTRMPVVRRALRQLRELEAPGPGAEWRVWVNGNGEVYLSGSRGPETLEGQRGISDVIDLIAPFDTLEGLRGPNLLRPRPQLRIVPGKLSGSPHVEHTRLETRALRALERDGLRVDAIAQLYPFVTREQIEQALDLERQLEANLALPAAA